MDDLSGLSEAALEIRISKLQKRVPYEQQRETKAGPHTWQAALLKPVLDSVSAHGHNPAAGGVTPPSVKGEDTATPKTHLPTHEQTLRASWSHNSNSDL